MNDDDDDSLLSIAVLGLLQAPHKANSFKESSTYIGFGLGMGNIKAARESVHKTDTSYQVRPMT